MISVVALLLGVCALGAAAQAAPKTIADIDVAKPFAAAGWRLTVTQGPDVEASAGDNEPGVIRICVHKGPEGPCDPDLDAMPKPTAADGDGYFDTANYLQDTRVVRPHGAGGTPLFLIRASSVHAGDGGQLVYTQLLAYRRGTDRFERVFGKTVGTNNNEEVRFVERGPLQGDVISAEPTDNAPYGFWITVSRPGPDLTYRQALKFRSATHYGDGNPLAVIDSEMPNIQSRLGLWRAGQPLPSPPGCKTPRLERMELWCEPRPR